MVKHYLDSSVVLAWLLEGKNLLQELEGEESAASSRIMWVEVSRVIHRALQTDRLDPVAATEARHNFARFAAGLHQIRLADEVLARASGPYPLNIRTLDAIHLASAEMWLSGELNKDPSEMSVWTLDRQMNLCAAQLGFLTPLLHETGRGIAP